MKYSFNNNLKIEKLLSAVFPKFCNNINCNINITFSDEIPPIFLENDKFQGKEKKKLHEYPIDLLMGSYYPESRSIVIYLQGINMFVNAEGCNCNYEDVLMLVILHEIGHFWYHHLSNTYTYTENTNVQEWVAQSFAFLVMKENKDIKECMEKLSKHQPIKYQTYNEITPISVNEFLDRLVEREDDLIGHVDMLEACLKYNC